MENGNRGKKCPNIQSASKCAPAATDAVNTWILRTSTNRARTINAAETSSISPITLWLRIRKSPMWRKSGKTAKKATYEKASTWSSPSLREQSRMGVHARKETAR